MRSLKILTLAVFVLALLPLGASAATTNFVAGAGYAAGAKAVATNAEAYTGSGSWYKNWTGVEPPWRWASSGSWCCWERWT